MGGVLTRSRPPASSWAIMELPSLTMLMTYSSTSGLTRLPVILVPGQREVIALRPLHERERSGANRLRLGIRALHRDRIDDVEVFEHVEGGRPRLLGARG